MGRNYWRIRRVGEIIAIFVNNSGRNPSKNLILIALKRHSFFVRILLLLICARLALPLYAGDDTNSITITPVSSDNPTQLVEGKSTNTVALAPWPNDGRIASATASMLQQYHYLHLPFNPEVSSKFLTLYLNTLDPQHIHFLQSDLDEFEKYRTTLGDLTLKDHDTSPAYVIFNRFMRRLEERSAYAKELLNGEPFEFTGDEQIPLNRKTAAYPKDMAEARELWRQRVRYEFLQEKLTKESKKELAKTMLSRHNPLALALTWQDFDKDIVKVINLRYTRILRNFKDWESDKVLETYLTSLAHVYDPHSDYFDKADLESFSIAMSLSLFGVGAELTSEDGYCKIMRLTPSGPAIKCKQLKPNDRIVAVAQGTNEPVDVVDMPLQKVVDKIRGPKGTVVNLTVIPADAVDSSTRRTVKLVRDEIKLEDQEAKAKIIEMPGADGKDIRLGVIDLPSFYASFSVMGGRGRAEAKSTTADVARLLAKLKKENVSGVILDLRHNGGGSLEEAINLTGLFIKEGPVVQVRDSRGDVRVDGDSDPSIQYDGPLIVLTSRLSASASEILAGALQDYGRALLVGGKSTHGKGTVQSMNQLALYLYNTTGFIPENAATLGALKYTTNKFYRVTGSSTQMKGVEPDIILPSTYDFMELGEASLENALPWDTNAPASYDKLNRVQPFLTELRKRSAARVASDKDFAYVSEDIEQVKKIEGDKNVSLNEAKRLKEMDENEVRQKARQDELKARKQPEQKVYEITLKQVDIPGLPAPMSKTNLLADASATSIKLDPSSGGPTFSKFTPSSGAGETNSASVTESSDPAVPKAEPAEPSPEEKAPLEEAEHILMDYISLIHSESGLTARHLSN
ncbi:MAG: carboxyl-terminal processing protease [Pedosphaera sp.]|nr:carboxyl-terminal processing protease [Pedosphaera sp.]